MMSFSAKWLGEDEIFTHALPEYKTYKKDMFDDRELVKDLWKLMDEADVVVAHNGDKFDNRKASARFIIHGLNPPSPYKSIDTLKSARRYFKFDSNKLDDLGKYFGLGEKVETGGYKLWQGCLAGNMESWDKMCEYNEQDVLLLEKVYLKLRPWMKNHPSVSLYDGASEACPKCGGTHIQKRGYAYTSVSKFQQYQCQGCGGWFRSRFSEKKKPEFTN